ncbi:MAG: DUF4386 domain-containing protein [Saprospiraceae bacterium]|nr:DUF4386 domain-containing protein [Saprospiraceae bacterium]
MKTKNNQIIALALGVVLGALTGLLTDNLLLWLSIGIALGAARANTSKCQSNPNEKPYNLNLIARIGGIGYLVIFASGIYANFVVLESMKVSGDKMATFQNLVNDQNSFFVGIASFIVMVLADLILTWSLFALFKVNNYKKSATAAWFRLINVVFFGAALIHLFEVAQLTSTTELLEQNTKLLANQVDLALKEFNRIWLIGLLFFGVHLILLARLMFKHIHIPKFIPTLLIIAGFGYLADSALQLTYSGYNQIKDVSTMLVVLPGIVGELALTFWLLFFKEKKTQNN